ncbi:MAG: hypothetical protein QF636_04515 [Arenicellales bacterium]|nr:hypothetical protein [Arenicellales bacterium]MDP6291192.1 hypothetical protein [Arenicellales bacterium]
MIDCEFFFRSTLGISSVMGLGPFAGFAVQCDPTSVARHGSIPGVLSYAIMADALSATDARGQTLTARSRVAGSQDRSLIFVYFKIRLRA